MIARLYTDLAAWWPLLSPPAEYAEEAAFYAARLREAGDEPAVTVLELGSGGGNNASHLKRQFTMVLVEPSAGMRAVSEALNPECEHLPGDMRSVRLGRQFDRVFVHDAIAYMTTKADLRRAIETAYVHCRPGGAALFAPDHLRETFLAGTDYGGSDGDGRGMRYLEWTCDPDPNDDTYTVDFAYLLKERDGTVHLEQDRHIEGLFSRADWLQMLADAGFLARVVPYDPAELAPGSYELFVAAKAR